MSDIKASERRLAAALDRIDYLLENAAPRRGPAPAAEPAATADPAQLAAIQSQLDQALVDNERLHAALEAMRPPVSSADPGEGDDLRIADLSDQAARLSAANEELAAANRGLIEAVSGQTDGVEAVALALEAEIEALRAARAAEIAQIADIMAELQRMLAASAATDAPFAADVAGPAMAGAEVVSFGDEGGVPELSREEDPGFDAVYGDADEDFGGDEDDLNDAGNDSGNRDR